MSMTVKDVQQWLSTLNPDDEVGVDYSGLTLQSVKDADVYLEVGGLPEEVEADDPQQAGAKYKGSDDPEQDFGKPSEALVGTEDDLLIKRADFPEPGSILPAVWDSVWNSVRSSAWASVGDSMGDFVRELQRARRARRCGR